MKQKRSLIASLTGLALAFSMFGTSVRAEEPEKPQEPTVAEPESTAPEGEVETPQETEKKSEEELSDADKADEKVAEPEKTEDKVDDKSAEKPQETEKKEEPKEVEPEEKADEPAKAATYEVKFQGKVQDGGQFVSGMTIDYGSSVKEVKGIDEKTFNVTFTDTIDYGAGKGNAYRYVDSTNPLEVVKVETNGSKVTVYFRQNQLPTLNWLAEGRNYPAKLTLNVVQNSDITLTTVEETPDKRSLEKEVVLGTDTAYTNNVSSWKQLEDAEVAKFKSVDAAVDYQYHEGTNDALIVWFHGNGEGSFGTDEVLEGANVAQMLANRGTVAWVTEEANAVFGDATVMAFQAPSMWYLATADDYLSKVKSEIDEVVKAKGISADEMYVSGCSAGGYMTTRMIITYPDLFKSAMINCPALDIASLRNVIASGNYSEDIADKVAAVKGATPTDEELAGLKNSRTAIWLVQGESDSSVDPANTSKRMWKFLSEGEKVSEKSFAGDKGIASGFTTYETSDNKYKLSLYKTVDTVEDVGTMGGKRPQGKLVFAEDFDLDGKFEEDKQSDHWSWIYTLRNNPVAVDGQHIWQWAKSYTEAPAVAEISGTQKLVIVGEEWGPAVNKTIIKLDEAVSADGLDGFVVSETKESTNWANGQAYNATSERQVTAVYLSDEKGNKVSAKSGNYVTVEMYISPNDGSPFRYDLFTGSNKWCDPYVLSVSGFAVNADGADVIVKAEQEFKLNRGDEYISEEAQKFDVTKSFTGSDGIVMPYGEFVPAKDNHKNALVVWLHGAGEGVGAAGKYNNDNFVDLLGNEVTALVSDEFQKIMKGAYVITPQAQTMWMDGGDGNYQNGEKGSMYRKTLMELIQNVVAKNPDIDPNRVIIGGCSNGGYMTMEMIVNYPDYFYKAYPICEALYDENITDAQIQKLADSQMGIWFTYSKDDPTVDPTLTSIPTIERLKKAGADVHVTTYDHVVDLSGRYKDENGNPHMYSGHWSWIYFFNNVNVDDADQSLNEWVWLSEEPVKVTLTDKKTGVKVANIDERIKLTVTPKNSKSEKKAVIKALKLDNVKDVAIFDITLTKGQMEIKELGYPVTITLPVPEGFGRNLAVYHQLDSGKLVRVSGVRVAKDGKTVSFEADSFSPYILVSLDNSKSARTGDSSNYALYALLGLVGLFGAAYVAKKRFE